MCKVSLEAIAKWSRGSGLAVNDSKTELCLFYRLDQSSIKNKIFCSEIESIKMMNVLAVNLIVSCNGRHK
jgi:hypothetical protein